MLLALSYMAIVIWSIVVVVVDDDDNNHGGIDVGDGGVVDVGCILWCSDIWRFCEQMFKHHGWTNLNKDLPAWRLFHKSVWWRWKQVPLHFIGLGYACTKTDLLHFNICLGLYVKCIRIIWAFHSFVKDGWVTWGLICLPCPELTSLSFASHW